MDNFGMMRSPSITPAQTFTAPPPLPPELEDEADQLALERQSSVLAHSPSAHTPTPQPSASFGMASPNASRNFATELDIGPDGQPHVKPRHYKAHSPTCGGRILDFVGVPTHLTVGGMLSDLMRLFLPATATTVLYFCNQAVTMMFVGRLLGVAHLAHYAVGISVFNIVGLSIGLGMATALDTLCSQAYGRDPRGPEVGILLQRGLLVCLSLTVPVIFGFYAVEPLLVTVFGPSLGAGVAVFLRASPPYLIALISNFCLQKTLQAQQLPILAVWANIASAVSCPLFNYWLTPAGVAHAAIAVALSVVVAVVVMSIGALYHPKSVVAVAPWPSPEAFKVSGAVEFLRVGIPGLLSVVAEWWAFEFIIAFSARYGENVVTAFTICMNILTFMFAIPSGLAVAAGVLCGNYLGANDPRGARSFARLSLLVGAVALAIVDGLLLMFGDRVFQLYTNDRHVLHLMNNVLGLLALFHVGDAAQSVLQGVFRGAGRQAMSARIVLVSLWCVGLPASWYLGSTMAPLDGILMGLMFGFVVEIPLLAFDMLLRWDWEALADAAATSKLVQHDDVLKQQLEQQPLAAAVDVPAPEGLKAKTNRRSTAARGTSLNVNYGTTS